MVVCENAQNAQKLHPFQNSISTHKVAKQSRTSKLKAWTTLNFQSFLWCQRMVCQNYLKKSRFSTFLHHALQRKNSRDLLNRLTKKIRKSTKIAKYLKLRNHLNSYWNSDCSRWPTFNRLSIGLTALLYWDHCLRSGGSTTILELTPLVSLLSELSDS